MSTGFTKSNRSQTREDIQMVFLDIDGTLFADGQLVPKSVAAVATLLEKNIPVSICTGRSVLHAKHIQASLGVPYGIFFNGGLVKTRSGELFSAPFDPTDVRGILDFATQHDIPTIVHTHDSAMSEKTLPTAFDPVLQSFDFPQIQIHPQLDQELDNVDIFQINAFMTQTWDARFEQRFPSSYIYRWDEHAVDFQRRLSDKSIGALYLLEHLGIEPKHALHIGDGGNDIGMFRALGHSVAMGNAATDVKQAAQQVTTDARDGGVADALIQLGLV